MDFSKFTHQYSLSKTLRFELKPVNETADYIEDYGSEYLKNLVKQDESRYDDYQQVKSLIDDLHRDYINRRLGFDGDGQLAHPRSVSDGSEALTVEDMDSAFEHYLKTKKTYKDIAELQAAKKQWTVYQTTLRKKLVTVFQDKADLFGKKLLSDFLPRFLQEQGSWGQHRELVKSFDKFSTYFSGFHENRKNMYVADDKATAIANRAINDNLPKFFENILVHQTIRDSEHASAINLEHSQQLLARFGVDSVSDVFTPGFYLKLFSQHGIDAFEELIGGIKADDSDAQHAESVVGINQNINQYRQQFNQTNSEAKLTRRSFPLMVRLHKQILATSNTTSFSYEPYTNDAGMLADLAKLVDEYDINEGFFSNLKQIMQQLKGADSSTIFIRSNALSQLSYAWLNNHAILPRAFAYHVEISSDFTTKVSKEKQLKLVDNSAKTKTVGLFSMADIEGWLAQLMASQDADSNALIIAAQQKKGTTLSHYFHQTFDAQLASMNKPFEQLLKELSVILNQSALDANRRPPQTNGVDDVGGQGFLQVVTIQQYMEASLNLLNVFKPLHLVFKRKEVEAPEQQDKGFYNEFSTLFTLMSDGLLTVYNKTRNHVTKKPYKSEKVKINFENPTLLLGWDANKEKSNSCVLFEKQGNYYLGVMHPKHRALFDYVIGMDELGKEKIVEKKNKLRESIITEAEGYRKVIYKLVPGVNKMLPKVFFSASRVGFFAPSEEIHRIRNTASFSKHGAPQKEHQKADFNLSDCHTLIDFYKTSIERHYEWRQFNFVFSPTSTYQDISQFYKELQDQAYRIEFDTINPTYIDQCVADGKLFLFQIYNKDFSPFSTGTKNLHTLYWLGLFEADNLKDVVLKLNGEAEIFFRRHSIKQKDAIVHQANKPIDRKNPAQAGQISQFKHDIVKDKRYTKDKFFFHVPITLNHKAKQSPRFNDAINQAVTTDTNVIGIDRGERHLLYYCVVSSHGDILAQGSLNTIKPSGGGTPVDYHHKLNAREKQRDAARKSWTNVENIKELKAGYLSQVVHKLTHLMVEHKAIVCLEDLNFGFKKGRFKVEKQVYQKFEKALIDKLNYWVDKKQNNISEPGHYLNALQLTEAFDSFEKMSRQSGALYYVRADYTSKICPLTGFVNLLKPYYQSVDKSQAFFAAFESIHFNGENVEFLFDYKKTNPSSKLTGSQTQWAVCSHGDRIVNKKNAQGVWGSETHFPTKIITDAFESVGIDYRAGGNVKSLILAKDTKAFFKDLLWGLRLTLQMRNSKPNSTLPEDDYLISPVTNNQGCYYDSRSAPATMPQDADANGAYHIALKGLWNIQQVTEHDWSDEKAKSPNLTMTNEQWFAFAQHKPFKKAD